MRLDVALVAKKIYTTRVRAVSAIADGLVLVNGVVAKRASQPINDSDKIVGSPLPFVSGRGALKLEHALQHFNIDVSGATCLDVGASTGGFTECLLNHGAAHVIAIDVGTNQMISELKNDSRVLSLENTDIREIFPNAQPDLIVIDVSFISLTQIADAIAKWNSPQIIALIKPQFEVPREIAARNNGVIKSESDRQFAIKNATDAFLHVGYKKFGIVRSPITGGSGNVEYLAMFEKKI